MAEYQKRRYRQLGRPAGPRRRRAQRGAASAHRSKRRRRRRRRNPLAVLVGYLIFVLLASAILAGVGWLLGSDLCAFNRGALRQTTVEVTAEDSVSTVADKLQDAGLIKYKWFFKLCSPGSAHADEKIGIGTYAAEYGYGLPGADPGHAQLLRQPERRRLSRVTIPEGYTVRQTIRLLAEKGVNTEEDLLEAAKTATFDYSFIDNNSEDISRLEGYLFPDTYEFYVNHNAKSALGKLISNFDDQDR